MKKYCLTFTFLLVIFSLFSQDIPEGFYSYKLENGLEIFVQEDFTVPTMKVEYISKAGTGRQTQKTTGFFQLYTRLFWKNNVSGKESYDKIGAGEFLASSGYSQSRYSFIVPSNTFEQSLNLFSNDLMYTEFSSKDIGYEYTNLKQEVTAWSASVPGFINASIDSRVFSKRPWTKDSGVYPALFNNYSIDEVRQELSVISDRWYVPDQSALFISGPISSSVVLELVKKYFSSWQSSYVIGSTSAASESISATNGSEDSKLFVIVSNDFSKDYIQSVLQYTAPGLGANNKYSATAWTAAEIMQTKLLEAGMSNTDTSFIADAADSRIIIQTLFDAQNVGDNTDISLMVPGFSNIVKSTAQLIRDEDVTEAKHRATLFRNDAYTGAANFMAAVAANWAYGGVEYFFEWPASVQSVELQDIKTSFNDPWIFVLVHSDLYEKNKERFDSFGYTAINKSTGAWYTRFNQEIVDEEYVTPSIAIPTYTGYTKSLIKEFELSSSIPVVTQSVPSTPWVSLLVTFKGGEVLHGEGKKGTEQIAIENISNTIERKLSELYFNGTLATVPSVDNSTSIYESSITVLSLGDDIQRVLDVVSDTIKESFISIAAADELFISSAYNWQIKSGSLDYQLYAAAMETLFGGTKANGLFDSTKELMEDSDYTDIKFATELLYDPKRMSLVLSGDISDSLQEEIEFYFGKQNFYPIEKEYRLTPEEEIKPIFSPFEQIVRLRHTFLTDIPSSLAGERPTKLIPTTDFSDPAQLYFEIPTFSDSERSLFVSLLYEVADRLTIQFNSMKNPPATNVSVIPGTGKFPVSSIRFSKVKSRNELKLAVDNTFNDLLTDLGKENVELFTTIKSRYTRILSREMLTLNDRSYLIQQGIRSSDNPSLYLENYTNVEGALPEDFLLVFKNFLDNGEFFWLFSADTKR